jgi:hypothetical protein
VSKLKDTLAQSGLFKLFNETRASTTSMVKALTTEGAFAYLKFCIRAIAADNEHTAAEIRAIAPILVHLARLCLGNSLFRQWFLREIAEKYLVRLSNRSDSESLAGYLAHFVLHAMHMVLKTDAKYFTTRRASTSIMVRPRNQKQKFKKTLKK